MTEVRNYSKQITQIITLLSIPNEIFNLELLKVQSLGFPLIYIASIFVNVHL